MTPIEFAALLQQAVGPDYVADVHPIQRDEPQFDVFPADRAQDSRGNPYRATFSVRSLDLDAIASNTDLLALYAADCIKNIADQRFKKRAAAPAWE